MSAEFRCHRRRSAGRSRLQSPHQALSGAVPGRTWARKRVFEFLILRRVVVVAQQVVYAHAEEVDLLVTVLSAANAQVSASELVQIATFNGTATVTADYVFVA